MSPKITVRSKKINAKDPTHMSLMVDSLSQEDINAFDINKVKDDLRSADFTEDEIELISSEVEEKLRSFVLTYSVKSVDTPFIRAFVNLVLVEKGFTKQLKSKKEYILSHNDLTQIIENSNNENGNTEHNPESINLTIAESVIKDYVLKNVFSKDVVKMHLEGKIHLHDLGMLRAYSYDGNKNFISVKINNIEKRVSLKEFYNSFPSNEFYDVSWDAFIKSKESSDIFVKDAYDKWVKVIRSLKHKDKGNLVKITLDNDSYIVVTQNHPCIILESDKYVLKSACDITESDIFLGIF